MTWQHRKVTMLSEKSEYLTKEITTPIPHMSDWTRLNIMAVHIWLSKMLRMEHRGMISSTGSIWPRDLVETSETQKSRLLRRRTARTLIRARA